jgi:ATP-dependent Lon protease
MRDDTAFMDRIHCFLPGWDVPKLNPTLFTDHFGLVSDFLSECFTLLRNQSRVSVLQGRVFLGGALSGRDLNGVNKTISGLLKLMSPDPAVEVSDADLEWAVRLALEVRRRVKEQQKRIGAAEFRNTHFSYSLGAEGVEKFVSTPELQSQSGISDEPLECGQIWTLSPGGVDQHPGLFRHRDQRRARQWRPRAEQPCPDGVQGVHPLCRAEPLRSRHATGRRPRSTRA